MTYQVYKPTGANGVNPVLVPDNTIDIALYDLDNKLGVQIPGKNSVDYGLPFAQNIVQMVSNFAGTVIPKDTIALQGQLWFNATSADFGNLFVRYTSNTSGGIANWKKAALLDSLETGHVSVVNPSVLPKTGDIKIASGNISIYGNNSWNGTTLTIANGGTGAATANDAFNALVPNQIGNNGKVLTTDGTNTFWSSGGSGSGISGGTAGQIPFQSAPSTTIFAPNFTYDNGTVTLGSAAGVLKTASGTHTLTIQTGSAIGTALSGSLILSTGNSSLAAAGDISVIPGTGIGTGAQTLISGGAGIGGTGNNNGGPLILAGGSASGTGIAGIVRFDTAGVEAIRITEAGSLSFSKIQQRILGDFNNYTISNRVLFQSSSANTATSVGVIPNGSSTQSSFNVYSNSDPTNSSVAQLSVSNTESRLSSGNNGTGAFVPLTVYTSGSERMRVDLAGNVGIGTLTPGAKLDVKGTIRLSGSASGYVAFTPAASAGSTTYVLPVSDGSPGQVLSTNGAGVLGWTNGVPSGAIMLWSGAANAIPTGWKLCDGTNSTPDLRDRFLIGAGGNYAVGTTGGSKDAVVVTHNHVATVNDPSHQHDSAWGENGETPPFGNSGRTNAAGSGSTDHDQTAWLTGPASTGISVGISAQGVSGTNANLPPYYALCYIMKT
jgi:hypothetical protein